MRVASIDIGSNSAILLIAERNETGKWKRISDQVEITRISEGLDASGVLAIDAVNRTAEVISSYREIALAYKVDQVVATGTAPFRRSKNGAVVASLLGTLLDAPIKIVSGEEEAQLCLAATRQAFPELSAMTILDIGGASTEIISFKNRDHRMISMDIGTVRLTERMLQKNKANKRQTVIAEINNTLRDSKARQLLYSASNPLIGIAGTVTTLAAMELQLDAYDETLIHGSSLCRETIQKWDHKLWNMSPKERQKIPGLPLKRADVIPVGALLLGMIMDAANVNELLVSDRGVRWGRLVDI